MSDAPVIQLVTAREKQERGTSEWRDSCAAAVMEALGVATAEAKRNAAAGNRPSSVIIAIAYEDGSIFHSAPTSGDQLVLLRGAAGRAIRHLDRTIDETDQPFTPDAEPEASS